MHLAILSDEPFTARVANPNRSLCRTLENLPKNIDFLGHNTTKTEEIHPKYRKIADSRLEFGPQNILFGPRVGHPCFRVKSTKLSQLF
jgi:hypothetical protein